ncbi:MAG TPA: hypothetical protein VN944_10795, partial [Nitrospiria bacterium]|nr:hypothetical protein [Nitrospiria bacterium]
MMKKLFTLLIAIGFLSGVAVMTAQASPDADGPDSGRDTAVTSIADHNPRSGHTEHAVGEVEKENGKDLRTEEGHESEVAGAHEIGHGDISGAEIRSLETQHAG